MRAMPKSASFGRPSSSKSTFAGLRSRWTTPRACACASPAAMPAAIANASSSGSGFASRSRSSSVPPGMYSSTMYGRPSRLAVVVELRDVRVRERGDRARLALEAGGVRVRREQLDRHAAAELEILGEPDLGHPAAAEQLVEPVAAGDDGFGHAVTLCARRGFVTHHRGGPGARARARAAARRRAGSGRGGRGRVTRGGRAAAVDLPPFASSAMDGFAIRAGRRAGTLTVVDRVAAGSPAGGALAAGEAIEISTGGVVPAGADAVVPLEDVVHDDNTIEVPSARRSGCACSPARRRRCAGATSSSLPACGSGRRSSARSLPPASPRSRARAARASRCSRRAASSRRPG